MSVIDAKENRDVAICDISGAFLQTKASAGTIIKLQGTLVDTLLKIDPMWKDHVVYEGKRHTPTIYSEAIKALYGTVDVAKLFYDSLVELLVDNLGFKTNPYDQCVVNKMINGKQCTIVWHVDDLKISHVDPSVVTSIIDKLDKRYDEIVSVSYSSGKVHDYLDMTFDFSSVGRVKITMYDYIHDLIKSIPPSYTNAAGASTPAPEHPYTVREQDDESVDVLDIKYNRQLQNSLKISNIKLRAILN